LSPQYALLHSFVHPLGVQNPHKVAGPLGSLDHMRTVLGPGLLLVMWLLRMCGVCVWCARPSHVWYLHLHIWSFCAQAPALPAPHPTLLYCIFVLTLVLHCLRRFPQAGGEMVWMTDTTPHESVAIPAGTRRRYVRLVCSDVSAWYADHSTPNPCGVVPPKTVMIIRGNKFVGYSRHNWRFWL